MMKYIKCKFSVWESFEVQTIITGFRIKKDQYELFENGLLVINRGYAWDGATGAFDTEDIIKASCVHDVFCELINEGLLPEYIQALADEEFRRIEKQQKMSWPRRMWTYVAVRIYQINKEPGFQRKVYEVP